MVLKQSLVLVACGLALGVPAAWASSSIVESLLFGLKPNDPRAIAAAATVMVTVALAAALHPGAARFADRSRDGATEIDADSTLQLPTSKSQPESELGSWRLEIGS